jgi:hypothetical protein
MTQANCALSTGTVPEISLDAVLLAKVSLYSEERTKDFDNAKRITFDQ